MGKPIKYGCDLAGEPLFAQLMRIALFYRAARSAHAGGRATGLIPALLVRRRIAVGQNVLDLELELSDGPHVPQKECFLTIAYNHERLFRDVHDASTNGDSIARIESIGVPGNGVNRRSADLAVSNATQEGKPP